MTLWIIGLSVFSSLLYRISGIGGFPRAKLLRRVGIPLLCYIPACLAIACARGIALNWLYLAISAGLLSLALTTYWDGLTRLWRGNEDEYWENWALTGLFYGLAAIPLIWCGVPWYLIITRAILLSLWTVFISEITGNVWIEEISRGGLIILTLHILFI